MSYVSSPATSISTQTRSRQAAVGMGAARQRAHRQALLEELESRVLLSVTPAIVGPATKLIIGVLPSNGFVNLANAFALEVDVEDANGNIVTTDSSTIKIKTTAGPTGSLHGTVQAKAVAGVALFSKLLFSKVGTYTVQVSDGALTTASGTITIAAAPTITTLVFSQQPVGNPTGASITPAITVQVKDQYGNLFTKPSSVSLKLSGPALAHITGTVSVKTVGGVATFSTVNVSKGGNNFVLQAKDGAHFVNSNPFAMGGPAVATSLEFLQSPTDTVAGAFITPAVTVEVKDQYHNVLVADHSAVKLTVATGLDSTKVFTASAKLGVATFSKLSYDIAGPYTLRASDGALTATVSGSFNINPGAAAGLVFAQIPASGALHSTASAVKVDIVDNLGNIVTTNTSTVTLTYASSPVGTAPLNLHVAAVGGVATFNALTFPLAGGFELKATDGPFTVNSKNFILI